MVLVVACYKVNHLIILLAHPNPSPNFLYTHQELCLYSWLGHKLINFHHWHYILCGYLRSIELPSFLTDSETHLLSHNNMDNQHLHSSFCLFSWICYKEKASECGSVACARWGYGGGTGTLVLLFIWVN